jgi:predicted CoA-binding protein
VPIGRLRSALWRLSLDVHPFGPAPGERSGSIRRLLERSRRIAVVGASPNPWRPSHGVVRTLRRRGYDVVPVNPTVDEVQGLATVATLADVVGPIDLVDVFRRPEHAPDIAEQAVAVGAGGLWLQLGVRSAEAARIAAAAELPYVEDACLAVEIGRFDHELTLPPT